MRRSPRWPAAVALFALALATALTFWPVRSHDFLNWDDPDLLIDNASPQQPAGPLLHWAWTTRHMGHYQPLSWLVFAATAGHPPSAAAVHTVALVHHAANALLLCWLIASLIEARSCERFQALSDHVSEPDMPAF